MSLLVWLPMTKDLTQQGLSNIIVSNNGATLDNNGKLGKCYYFDGNAHYVEFSKAVGDLYSGDFSYAVWLKPTDDTRSIIFSEYAASGASGIAFELSASRGIRLYWNGSPDIYPSNCTLPKNEWSHVVITRSGNIAKFYINGELRYTYSGTLADKTSTAKIRIGDDYRGGTSVSYQGYMNDARIYDSCLSPREVELLSRGLVCHYPLNGGGRGGDNLLKNTNQGKTGWVWSCANGSRTVEDYETTGVKLSVVTAGSGWNMFYYNDNNILSVLQPDTDYTVSMDILPPESKSINCSIRKTDSTNAICDTVSCNVVANKWNHAVFKLHSVSSFTASNQVVYMNGIAPDTVGKTIYIKNIKLEKGSIATPWMPNPADSAYSAIGYDSTTEYDVSGNENNGTKVGTISYSSDAARYNVSTKIGSTSSYIQIPNLTTTGFADSYSFAWWGKVSTYNGKMMWGFSNGIRLNGIFNGNFWNTGDSANNPLYVPGTTTQVTAPTVNVWHHWVMTGDGTTCKVYQDGILWATAKTYKSISGTSIYINGWDSGTGYSYDNYQMSDFRIYATTLSAAQVAELYNTAVSVANNGTLLGYELVEV